MGRHQRQAAKLEEAAGQAFHSGDFIRAAACLRHAIDLAPSLTRLFLLGVALHRAGETDEAIRAFAAASSMDGSSKVWHLHLAYGNALASAGRLREAAARYRETIRLKPLSVDAHGNLAQVLFQLREYEGALPEWDFVLQREPGSFEALLKAALCQQELCDWRGHASGFQALRAALDAGKGMHGTAFFSVRAWDDCDAHRRASEAEARFHGVLAEPRAAHREPIKRGPVIRLAYVSADFRKHPTSRLISGLLERHDRGRFETIAVSLCKDDGSPERRRIEAAADKFFDVHDINDGRAAGKLRDCGIDIAIDLMGYTSQARIGIFGHRAAPVQVTYLGYPGSLCVPAIDYMIVDPFVASAGVRRTATEKLAVLPDCYQCNDRTRPFPVALPKRSACELPEQAFVFASFNHQAKIAPEVFDVWMRILHKVKGSVLWLLVHSEQAKANLRAEAEERGVPPSRLIFAGAAPHDKHMARLALVDLQLDTFPYNAHTTASDALWVGCPIVTFAGESFQSRVCGSLLTTIGVPELIAKSWDDYETIAVRLAQDREELGRIRARIAHGRDVSPLFDMAAFCRHIERAYEEMMVIAESGRPPQEIDVRRII
jgi:protein O-GlcNAc transferase